MLPTLVLGTAQWGWTVPRTEAFRLLDAWLRAGHRGIDAATNYPINRQPGDFRAAEKILEDYIRAHGLRDLQVTMKVGSLDNLRSPEANLAPSFLLMMAGEYHRRYGENLACIMVHWDNRSDEPAIRASLEALQQVQNEYGLRIGLSGLAHPEIYARVNTGLGIRFDIQLKHNVFHSDLDRYRPLLALPGDASDESLPPTARVFAYGLNAGGLKLEGPYPTASTFLARGGQPEEMAARLEQLRAMLPGFHLAFVRPPVKTMNHFGLIYAGLHPRVDGLVLGLSSVGQLSETLDFWRNLDTFDYTDVFAALAGPWFINLFINLYQPLSRTKNSMEKKPEIPAVNKPALVKPTQIAFADADISTRYNDVYQDVIPDEVADVRWRDGAYEFICKNHVTLRVQVLTPDIIRLRYTPDGTFAPDFSYALDPDFQPEKVVLRLHENPNEYVLLSEQLQVVVSKLGLQVKIYDRDDRVLCEDAGGFTARRTVMQGWNKVLLEKKCHRKEVFFGLGDKSCGTNLAGKKFQNWCTDSYAFDREEDPLYRAIPFYYSLHQGVAYGVFLDNTFRTHFDFDMGEAGGTRFWAEGGELNYYFLYGPAPVDVCRAYARLTGRPALPPLWTLGYHQSRWSYYPDTEILSIAEEFRAREIPCDALYLDIDYMDGYRCFTWHAERFPDPKRLVDELRQRGFETVAMIDPGIKEDPDYAVYQEGVSKNMFVRTADGDLAKAPVWPGFCVYPDFTHPEVRAWWGELHRQLYQDLGISGFWNDMNEPAVFHINHKTLPNSVLHQYDGHPCSHRKAHNVYGQQMSRASWEGLRTLQPERRPYLLTRATYSGGQRYAAVWTGDNVADWENLQIANIQCQRLAISGFSFCGTDIGGFTGCTDGELFVRWLQLAVFHPLMRTHSKGSHAVGDAITPIDTEIGQIAEHTAEPPSDEIQLPAEAMKPPFRQEPWSYGEKWTVLAKKAIELRYALLPCLYTAMWRNTQDGSPVLQHLAFADPNDPKLWEQERDFLFGEHLLVSPVVQPRLQRQGVYLPKGQWYYFWTGQPAAGEMFVNVLPDQIPFFVREGAVLPVYPIRQWIGERSVEELTLYVYYKEGQETSHLYEDAGEGYDYQNNGFSLKQWDTDGQAAHFTLRQTSNGAFAVSYQKVKIYLVGYPAFVTGCQVDGDDIPIKEIKLRDRSLYTLSVAADFNFIEWRG